jgi:hypothetical protein
VLSIEIVRALTAEFAVSAGRAVELATSALQAREPIARVITPSGIVLVLPIPEMRRRLRAQIVEAIETVAHRRRGRPPLKR